MKMIRQQLVNAAVLATCTLVSLTSLAEWQLKDPSEVTFVSAKNSHLLETHRFKKIAGSVSDDGQASIKIDLSSIDSRIPVRDQRMREHLFEVNEFASAEIRAQIPAEVMQGIKKGELQSIDLKAVLNLHGNEEALSIPVVIVPAKDGSVIISNLKPVLLHADDFALTQGIRLLQEIAKLKVISEVVPVNFTLSLAEK